MKKEFSRSWVSSTQPRKQRKYRYNIMLHLRHKFVSAHLSKELRKQYGLRSIIARVGDKVKVMRGQFKKTVGKIEEIDSKKAKAYVTGVELIKKDGSKAKYPVHASNLMLLELNLDDKKRLKNKDNKNTKSNGGSQKV
nr:50S ribosomal protein L24P [uncultured archaeon]